MPPVLESVRSHEEWRSECINLIASENVTSKDVRSLLGSDFGHRYTLPFNKDLHGVFVENAYRGTKYLDEVEGRGEDLAKEVFGCQFSSLKPLSGHVSSILMLLSCCRKGETILTVSPEDGGYDGYAQENVPRMLGMECAYLPFDKARANINYESAAEMIREVSPALVVVGTSFLLFPYDLKALRDACDEAGAKLGYDASHVLGLIAGRQFQDPFKDGVDVVIGSTHKSLFGPQGGIFLTSDKEIFRGAKENLTWRILDNAHWNRIAALARALEETKEFGREYARTCIGNANALARELDGRGIPVLYKTEGFTRSSQVLLDSDAIERDLDVRINEMAIKLEESNIIIDAVGRMGTNEITRLGAQEGTMADLAELMSRGLSGENVLDEVKRLRGSLSIKFCF